MLNHQGTKGTKTVGPVRADIFVEPSPPKEPKLRPQATSSENIAEHAAPTGLMDFVARGTTNMPLLWSCPLTPFRLLASGFRRPAPAL